MKELSIEEKAKRYDKCLERAKNIIDVNQTIPDIVECVKSLFPELVKSEDEEIRKEITEFFKNYSKNGTWKTIPDVTKWIDWLEKQVELDNNEDVNILYRFSFYSYKDEPNVIYLSGLYVNEEYRNKGIGTKILEVTNEVTKNLDCYAIRLKTKKGSDAERLYRIHGYNSLSTEEKDEIWLEKRCEQKSLNEITKEITKNKETATLFLKSCGIMNANGELADEYKIEQDEQKPVKVESKFKIGDVIEVKPMKCHDKIFIGKPNKIVDMTEKCYILDDGKAYSIEELQDGWKLSEQKPTDNIEPKFNNGDWVIYNNDICQIVKREEGCNKLVTVFGIEKELVNERNLSTARLWTIQDAKDGDVLSGGTTIFIFKNLLSDGSVMSYCDYDTNSGESDAFCPLSMNLMCSKITPATKEQRDIFFSKMEEFGYKWNDKEKELFGYEPDIEKKELKDIEQTLSWSDEDEKKRKCLIKGLEDRMGFGWASDPYSREEYINWLKSLRLHLYWKPSEEQISALEWQLKNTSEGSWQYIETEKLLEQIKKL